ncbi:lytic transglycosylase domain-containing protein [Ralstonia mojiangensis]|uniref:lytic transglycosylase domain-containing protein n=1 Tax=Ralstonia mojiangensis TaxID=2953895 RepID=UPI0028F40D1B|nr:lytic transglycosylase domain-containing protein [Ralstonia mojiangensis]
MIRRLRAALLLAMLAGAEAALATPKAPAASASELPLQCFVAAGQRYRIDPMLLYAIAEVESNLVPSAINRNRNGSIDYGVMQINSLHLSKLKSVGIDERRLLDEPCVAVHVGASILAELISRHGYTWAAVGAYNAGSSATRGAARHAYATKVWASYAAMISARESATQGAVRSSDRRKKKGNATMIRKGLRDRA